MLPGSDSHFKVLPAPMVQASHIQVDGAQKVTEVVSLDHSLAITDFQVRGIREK